jgi:chloramphenicol-sensitive protein RarD
VNHPHRASISPSGIWSAIGAFFLWGVLPLYWKALQSTPPATIIAHRTLWSLLILWIILAWQGKARDTIASLRQPRIAVWHLLAGLLLAGNWLLYVWATLNDKIIDAAFGYYLNPFFNMLFGYLLFAERQTRLQVISIAIALIGAACQLSGLHGFPWIAFVLALSFSLYAVVRKKSSLGSLPGLSLETLILAPLALFWLGTQTPTLTHTLHHFPTETWLLLGTGIATATPLLLFGHATRTISLTTLGMLQFLGPTLQFLIGWKIYHEPMTMERTLSLSLIWIAIALYGYSLTKSTKPKAVSL